MDQLINGYRRFRSGSWALEHRHYEMLAASGQRPHTMIIACSDSRVDPQMIFKASPGELFVVRNVANLVPPYAPDAAYHGTSAALEFAVCGLKIEHIVVLGHALCGGIQALVQNSPTQLNDFVMPWMQIAESARRKVFACEGLSPEQQQELCEYEGIKVSLENLKTFPWISERIKAGKLTLHGCTFDIRSGVLMKLGGDGKFSPVAIEP